MAVDRLRVAQLRQGDNALKYVCEARQMVGAAMAGGVCHGVGVEGSRIVRRKVESPHVHGEVLSADLSGEAERALAKSAAEVTLAHPDACHQLRGGDVIAPGEVQVVGVRAA